MTKREETMRSALVAIDMDIPMLEEINAVSHMLKEAATMSSDMAKREIMRCAASKLNEIADYVSRVARFVDEALEEPEAEEGDEK